MGLAFSTHFQAFWVDAVYHKTANGSSLNTTKSLREFKKKKLELFGSAEKQVNFPELFPSLFHWILVLKSKLREQIFDFSLLTAKSRPVTVM